MAKDNSVESGRSANFTTNGRGKGRQSFDAETPCIVHFIGRLIPGGAERRTLELIEETNGFRHIICVTSGRRGTLDLDYQSAGAVIEYLRIKSVAFPFRLFRLLKRHRVDVTHSNIAYTSGYISLLAFLARVPNRITIFLSDNTSLRPGTFRKFQRKLMRSWINRYSTQIVGLTPQGLEIAWSENWQQDPRCKIAPRGVSSPRVPQNIPSDISSFKSDIIIAHAGRADLPTKNREKAIIVFAAYREFHPNSRLIFIGRDGKDRAEEEKNRLAWSLLTHRYDVADRVHFLGEKDRVGDYLSCSDGLLFTSTLEGLPGVVLEALGAGLPVVSSRLPGTDFISQNVRNVTLLDAAEPDIAWAAALNTVAPGKLGDRSRLEHIAAFQGSLFTIDAAARRYSSLWREHLIERDSKVFWKQS